MADIDSLRDFYDNFAWDAAPLRSFAAPVWGAIVYLVAVGCLYPYAREQMDLKKRQQSTVQQNGSAKVPVMTHVMAGHNMVLCIWSLIMCGGTLFEVHRRVGKEGSMWWLLCEHPDTTSTGPLFFWSWMYYISKYYELLDTIFTLLKGTIPPSFTLGVYHHAVVLFMAWLWPETAQSLQFYGLLFNTFVHVIMYYYYYLRAYGHRVWWKNAITYLQIIQFASSFALLATTLYHISAFPMSQWNYECSGMHAVAFNALFNVTLLSAFIGVLRANKQQSNKAKQQ